jgi:peptidoglycan hydrolase CwlO-like protein
LAKIEEVSTEIDEVSTEIDEVLAEIKNLPEGEDRNRLEKQVEDRRADKEKLRTRQTALEEVLKDFLTDKEELRTQLKSLSKRGPWLFALVEITHAGKILTSFDIFLVVEQIQ